MLPGKSSLGSITGTHDHSGQDGDRLIFQTVAAGFKGGNLICYTLHDLITASDCFDFNIKG